MPLALLFELSRPRKGDGKSKIQPAGHLMAGLKLLSAPGIWEYPRWTGDISDAGLAEKLLCELCVSGSGIKWLFVF